MSKSEYHANRDPERTLRLLMEGFSTQEKSSYLADVIRVAERLSAEADEEVLEADIEVKAQMISRSRFYPDGQHTERILSRAVEILQEEQ